MSKRNHTLYDMLLRAAGRAGSVQAVADAMDMSLSALLRGAKASKITADNLLRLAEVIGEDPSEVLSLAGKQDTAERIGRLYGKPRAPLTDDERALLALDSDTKRHIRKLAELLQK